MQFSRNVTATRPGLCRRLHRWAHSTILRRRIRKLSREVVHLRQCLREDQYRLERVQRQGDDVSVPLSRMRDDGARLRDLVYQLARANSDLQQVEGLS